MDRLVTLLPLPLSPMTPEIRPARKVVDRSLTAYTGPWAVSKHTERC